MANINKELNQIKNAVYGREVRGSIHDGIDKINKETEIATGKADEAHDVMESIINDGFDNAALESNFEQKLDDKINNLQPEWTQFKEQTNQQLAEKTTYLNSKSIKLTKTTTEVISPKALFILDDGYKLDLTLIKPIFDRLGIVGCTAVITDRIGTGAYLNENEIKELANGGWEINSHSKSHTHLTQLSDSELVQELKGSRDTLRAMGYECRAFITPFSDNDARTRTMIRKYYDYSFSKMSLAANTIPVNMHDLLRTNMGDDVSRPFSYYKEYIDRGIKENAMMVFCLHSNQFGSAEQRLVLEQTIEYLQSNNIEITTPSKAIEKFGNAFEMWNEYTGEHTVISNTGEMFGTNLDFITQLETNSVDLDTTWEDFPRNKISFCKITNAHARDNNFPLFRGGILVVDNRFPEDGYPNQQYLVHGRPEIYTRYNNTSGNWSPFRKSVTDDMSTKANITYNNNWSGNLEVIKNDLNQIIIRGRLTVGDVSTPRTQIANLGVGFSPKHTTAVPSVVPNNEVINGLMVSETKLFIGSPAIDILESGSLLDINFIYPAE